jgi:hypothetical protein
MPQARRPDRTSCNRGPAAEGRVVDQLPWGARMPQARRPDAAGTPPGSHVM